MECILLYLLYLMSTPLCVLQMALLSTEMHSVREESTQMRAMAEVQEPSEQFQSAIRDRDDAITKYVPEEMIFHQEFY